MRSAEANSELVASRSNPYLTGVHTPMRKELTIENLPVMGTIAAAWNAGSSIR
jgi:hypothetical protein